jgi:hypothetical protein
MVGGVNATANLARMSGDIPLPGNIGDLGFQFTGMIVAYGRIVGALQANIITVCQKSRAATTITIVTAFLHHLFAMQPVCLIASGYANGRLIMTL